MQALVTGASGYTGGQLVRTLLAGGWSVRALVRDPRAAPPLRALGARVVIGDVTRPATLAGLAASCTTVYHLVGSLSGGTAAMERVLVEGTRNLIECCLAGRASGTLRSFVLASNAVVYGQGGTAMLTEGSPCLPSFPRGRLGLRAEQLVSKAYDEYGLPATILRLGAIYGPGRISSALLRTGRFRIVGSGANHSSRIHIDDLLAVLEALGREPRPGQLYCAADRVPSSLNEYYVLLTSLLGVAPPRHIAVAEARLRGGAGAAVARLRGRAPTLDANVLGLFTADLRLDSTRLWAELGLAPRYPSYGEGLPASVAAETAATGSGAALTTQATR